MYIRLARLHLGERETLAVYSPSTRRLVPVIQLA